MKLIRIVILCAAGAVISSACDQNEPASPPSSASETAPVPVEDPAPLPGWTRAPAHPSRPGPDPDYRDPASVARAVLTAYRRPHRGRVRELSGSQRLLLEDEIDLDPRGPAAQAYGDRYLEAARTWSGEIGPIRMRGRFAYCRFATDDLENVHIVELERQGDRWVFSQIGIMSRDEWEAEPDAPLTSAAVGEAAEREGDR